MVPVLFDNDKLIFQKFVEDDGDPSSTDVNLCATGMKYLNDNRFRVIPTSDLVYGSNTNFMYLQQIE